MNPNAPNTAMMSPKKGSIAAIKVATLTYTERRNSLGMRLRRENLPVLASPDFPSKTSNMGCEYTKASANNWRIIQMLAVKSSQLGTREGSPAGAKLLNMLPADRLPNAQ